MEEEEACSGVQQSSGGIVAPESSSIIDSFAGA
jgi:hypothetical protein